MEAGLTDDAKRMLGDPRKALFSMAVPIALANILVCCNNVIDSVWLAGLGTASLAATGVVFPFFFLIMGIGNGIGVGASQAIARRIGAEDYANTHRVASQAVYMTLIAGAVSAAVLLLFTRPLLETAGAGEYIAESMEYAFPMFLSTPVILMTLVLSSMLRSEGAAKRMMYMSSGSALMNMALDPIFIYVFGWGVSGAAWATAVSMTFSLSVGLYWYFVKRDTFVRIPMRNFRFDAELDRDILRVGIPAAFEIAMIGAVTLVMNLFAYQVDPVSGVAVFGTGWRAIDLLIIPGIALGNAVVPIAAAAYGADRLDKVRETFRCSALYGLLALTAVGVFTFVAAPQIAMLFSYGESAEISEDLIYFLRTGGVFMPVTALAYSSFGLFQSLGMGVKSMIGTAGTSIVRIPICAVIMMFSATFAGLCSGILAAEVLGSVLSFIWASAVLRKLIAERAE